MSVVIPTSIGNVTMVYDRSIADVTYAKNLRKKILNGTNTAAEYTEFATQKLKGAFNVDDLNRIEAVVELFLTAGICTHAVKVNFNTADVLQPTQMGNLVDNLTEIFTYDSLEYGFLNYSAGDNLYTKITWYNLNKIERQLEQAYIDILA